MKTCLIKKILLLPLLTGCNYPEKNVTDVDKTIAIGEKLSDNQPTPTDIYYSLERYNLIRRAYWVNGQKEKARTVSRPAEVPLGYCVLFSDYGQVIAQFAVDGKVTSLNSYLTPDSEYYELVYGGEYSKHNNWLPDVDGSYGTNDNGIFFFTPEWQYIEWSGMYLYSDTPFQISSTVLEVY